jgi:hypothetical protein
MADKLTTLMRRLSRNLGASTSWNPQGLPRPVMGLLIISANGCEGRAVCRFTVLYPPILCRKNFQNLYIYNLSILETSRKLIQFWERKRDFYINFLSEYVNNISRKSGVINMGLKYEWNGWGVLLWIQSWTHRIFKLCCIQTKSPTNALFVDPIKTKSICFI